MHKLKLDIWFWNDACKIKEQFVWTKFFTYEIVMYECSLKFSEKCKTKLGSLLKTSVKNFSLLKTKVTIYKYPVVTEYVTAIGLEPTTT